MKKWIAVAAGAAVAALVVSSWDEIVRYWRIRAM
jgi:hypothetical protein